MMIYIDPFWAGFALGVIGSVALSVGLIIYCGIKSSKKKGS